MANTANTLTGLIPTIYEGLDIVSRELVGFIPSVSRNASESMAAKGQTIRIPVVPSVLADDITPGNITPEAAGQVIGYTDMEISKFRMVKIHWNGEEEMGMSQNGQFNKVLADQFAQGMRTLANEMEADLAGLYLSASRAVGAGGTNPFASNFNSTADLHRFLADNGSPLGNKRLVIDTAAGAALRSLTSLNSVSSAGSDAGLRQGVLLDLNGFQIRESGQIATQTAGTGFTTKLTADAKVGDLELTVVTAAGEVNVGDVIALEGDTAHKYIVTSRTNAKIGIAAPGVMKKVVTGKGITVSADYAANMAFDANAIVLLARAPAVPAQGDMAADRIVVTDPISGIPFQISMYKQYRQVFYEVAVAWGVKLIKPEHVALLLG